MGREVDLLVNYPRTKRSIDERGATKTEADRAIARKFGREFFDGDRSQGYGGFNYMPRFWQPVVPTFREHFGLKAGDSILDVGCAKGFMMHDMAELIPGLIVKGIDISDYAVANAMPDMKPHVQVADTRKLPFPDKSFDVVISVNTVHNLERSECGQALREIERVGAPRGLRHRRRLSRRRGATPHGSVEPHGPHHDACRRMEGVFRRGRLYRGLLLVHPMNAELSQRLLHDMMRIRAVEEAIVVRYSEQKMRCPVHLSVGQRRLPRRQAWYCVPAILRSAAIARMRTILPRAATCRR